VRATFASQHNLAYWLGRDYLGIGIGAVFDIESSAGANAPGLGRYLQLEPDTPRA